MKAAMNSPWKATRGRAEAGVDGDPWQIVYTHKGLGYSRYIAKVDAVVAGPGKARYDDDQNRAVAMRIAALPEVAKLLRDIIDEVKAADGPDGCGYGHACNIIEILAGHALEKLSVTTQEEPS